MPPHLDKEFFAEKGNNWAGNSEMRKKGTASLTVEIHEIIASGGRFWKAVPFSCLQLPVDQWAALFKQTTLVVLHYVADDTTATVITWHCPAWH